MVSQKTIRIIIFVLVVAALALLGFIIIRSFFYAPNDEVPLSANALEGISEAEDKTVTAEPVRLTIPKIGVDAEIRPVGVTRNGNMATPTNFSDVGWYKYGTIPGNQGSAVIAGHVNNGAAFPAVFYDLKQLEVGDEIYVENEAGELLRFTVIGTKTYDFDAKADEVFTDKSGKLLRLITCTGTWVQKYRTHDKRLVVTAELSE